MNTDYAPLTQEMIDFAAALNRRIELAGATPIRLTVSALEGQNYAWEKRGRPGHRKTVQCSVLPEGQPAKVIR